MLNLFPLTAEHWADVKRIYLEGIATGNATFETKTPTWGRWSSCHHPFARLVAIDAAVVKGWAALSPVSSRKVYAGVAEVSVYVGSGFRGLGVGKQLLEALILESEANGIWTLQASIFPENLASLELHIRCGFREVGRRELIAKMAGRWRSTLLLERRSIVVGVD